ncbi:MAG: AlpA family phage regulatory protein [Acidimicrobiaceae bacterium]|nr:AlpA family phage regulatory protein [Acidimicrobiaceae bacterium]
MSARLPPRRRCAPPVPAPAPPASPRQPRCRRPPPAAAHRPVPPREPLTCRAGWGLFRRVRLLRLEARSASTSTAGGAEMSPRNSNDAMLRVPDVLDRIGVSRRTLCRWRADGTFPQALQLGANSIGWPRQVIDEWLASRPRAGM